MFPVVDALFQQLLASLYPFALLGMFVLPLLPIMMENCAECTYPVPEEVSMGILFAGCNILGLGFIFAIQVSDARSLSQSKTWKLIL